ncbi:type IV pilin protein [Motiliproteus sp. SC1-56]|uniref:type IV pilin protein n=1 Tax=Motiliproteus sp. SC1-56 TaxID=2799565 RepID=UPI001A8FCF56|nr:type IV pilin protein [Motiliproteus sp. SC1-56]
MGGSLLRASRGFGLLELMIALAIIGILAAVALPAYQGHVQRSTRSEALGLMQAIAGGMESYALNNGSYSGAVLNGTSASVYRLNADTHPAVAVYNFTLPAASLTTDSYVILATPIAGKRMAGDGKLILYHDGRRGWDSDDDGDYEAVEF